MIMRRALALVLQFIGISAAHSLYDMNAVIYVSGEEEFRQAIASHTVIQLTSNISLTDGISIIDIMNITIIGNGFSVDGQDKFGFSCFRSSRSEVAMINLIITHCAETALSSGGGLFASESIVRMVGCDFVSNSAGQGGGLSISYSNVSMAGCAVSSNTATTASGGGILVADSTLSMTSCTIASNAATLSGGGLLFVESMVSMTGCDVSSNAARQGGGIFLGGSNVFFARCTVSSNTASDIAGGIALTVSSLSMMDCEVSSNTASQGGGMYLSDTATSMTRCTISFNTASDAAGGGGGMILADESMVSMAECEISSNMARSGGGMVIYGYTTVWMIDCEVLSNTASRSAGGIYIDASDVFMAGCSLSSNTATAVGLGFSAAGCMDVYHSTVSMTACEVLYNTAIGSSAADAYVSGSLGGIGLSYSAVSIIGCTISSNTATSSAGGMSFRNSKVSMAGCDISENTATIQSGGISICCDSDVSMTGCAVSSNTANTGGGMFISNSTVSLMGCVVYSNKGSEEAGGLYVSHATVTMADCEVWSNKATKSFKSGCGGMSVSFSVLSIAGCVMSSNKGSSRGGGVCAFNSKVTVAGSELSFNTAKSGKGGAIFAQSSNITMTSSDLEGNMAISGGALYLTAFSAMGCSATMITRNEAVEGGGVFAQLSSLWLNSSVVSQNSAGAGGGGLKIVLSSALRVDSSVIVANKAQFSPGGGLYLELSLAELRKTNVYSNEASGSIFEVTEGPCSAIGGCFTSTRFGTNTYTPASCSFSVAKNGTLTVESFDVFINDYLKVGPDEYTGSVGPSGVAVRADQAIEWVVGSIGTTEGFSGFKICLDQQASSGGGIYSSNASLLLSSVNISKNSAADYGGGVSLDGGSLIASDSELAANEATEGEALYFAAGYVDAVGMTVSGTFAGASASSTFCGSPCGEGAYGLCSSIKGASSCSVNCDCALCPNGTKNGKEASTSPDDCIACGPGQVSEEGDSVCTSCEAGRYSANTTRDTLGGLVYKVFSGATSCNACPAGYYTLSPAAVVCDLCAPGRSSREGSSTCDLAAPGYFVDSTSAEGSDPVICPENAYCPGDDSLPLPMVGFWIQRRKPQFAIQKAYACLRETCKGGSPGPCWVLPYPADGSCDDSKLQCTEGAAGPVCGSCAPGFAYSSTSFICAPCDNIFAETLVLVVVGLVATVTAVGIGTGWSIAPVFVQRSQLANVLSVSKVGGVLRVLFSTYQIISTISTSAGIPFPEPFRSMLQALSMFSLDFLSLACLKGSSDFLLEVVLWSISGIFLTLLIVLIYFARLANPGRSHGFDKFDLFQQHTNAASLLSFMLLPVVTQKQFQALDCVRIAKKLYLRVDTSVECWGASYRLFTVFDGLMMAIYLGVPLLWFSLLHKHRHVLNPNSIDLELVRYVRSRDRSVKHLAFLFCSYKGSFYFFEVVEVMRRIFFIGAIPLISSKSSRRAALGMFASLCSAICYGEMRPYENEWTNSVVHVAQFVVLANYGGALVLSSELSKNVNTLAIGVVLLFVNASLVGAAFGMGLHRYNNRPTVLRGIAELQRVVDPTALASLLEEMQSPTTSSCVVYWYTSHEGALVALRDGIYPHNGSSDVLVSAHRPFEVNDDDESAFPEREAVLCVVVPRRLLNISLSGSSILRISGRALWALTPRPMPLVLPPTLVARAFQFLGDTTTTFISQSPQADEDQAQAEFKVALPFASTAAKSPGSCLELLGLLNECRRACEAHGLFMLFHYTDSAFEALIQEEGIPVSSHGANLTAMGPASHGVGSAGYEDRLRAHLGERRPDERRAKGGHDLVVVYAAEPSILATFGGGVVVPRSFFEAASTLPKDGAYFLRPDRIVCMARVPAACTLRGAEGARAELALEAGRDISTHVAILHLQSTLSARDNEVSAILKRRGAQGSFSSLTSLEDGHDDLELHSTLPVPLLARPNNPLIEPLLPPSLSS